MTIEIPNLPMPLPQTAPEPEAFWTKLARVLAKIPFAEDLVAGYLCALDRTTPTRVRMVLLGAAAYFVMPADAIPDIMLGLGFTDDAAVIAAVIAAVGRHIRPEHREAARERLDRIARS